MTDKQKPERTMSQKLVRTGLVIAAAVGLVWGGMRWGLPAVLVQQVQQQGSAILGRDVTVREIEVSPWSLTLTLHGVAVAGASAQWPAVSVERAVVNVSAASLLRWGLVLDALELKQPIVRVAQDAQGHWDFEDVIAHFQNGGANAEPDEGLPRLVLNKLQILDGQLEWWDHKAGVHHVMEGLQAQLPWMSTLASQRERQLSAELSVRWNGSDIALHVQGTPFDAARNMQAQLRMQGVDLASYAAYVPQTLPIRVEQGQLDAALAVRLGVQDGQFLLQLQGSRLAISALQLSDSEGAGLAGWQQLELELGDTRPLEHQVHIAKMALAQPYGYLHRHADGRWLPAPTGNTAQKEILEGAGQAGWSSSSAVQRDWSIHVDALTVREGRALWRDSLAGVDAQLQLQNIGVQAQDLAWPWVADTQWRMSAQLQAPTGEAQGRLYTWGSGRLTRGKTAVVLEHMDIQAVQAYVKPWLNVPLSGRASLSAGMAWKEGRLHAQVPALRLESVTLGRGMQPAVQWSDLHIQDAHLDTAMRQVHLGQISLHKPQLRLARDARGRWMYASWLAPSWSVRTAAQRGKGRASDVPAQAPWQLSLQTAVLDGGLLEFTDAAVGEQPLAIQLSALRLNLQEVDVLQGAAQVQLSAQLAERGRRGVWGATGMLAYQGRVQAHPWQAQGRVQIQGLPLQAFEPYIAPHLNVRLVRALASWHGNVLYAQHRDGPQLQLQGAGRIADVIVQSMVEDAQAQQAVQGPLAGTSLAAEDLLRWKQLRLDGVRVEVQPAQPPRIQVQRTDLQDFYARVVVLPQGQLNLQNLIKKNAAADEVGAAPPLVAVQPVATAHATSGMPRTSPYIEMGPIALQRGVIKFSDYFIEPNYTADLTALNGHLAAFSSAPAAPGEAPAMAALTLDGVAQGTAQLSITGEVNPLAQPLAMDIHAKMEGLDLSPLTPYAIKYAGHGIEKGKLSMDVRYQVQPDGQLSATNQLVLNQLTFGDPVAGAPASLPVRLAVALLADSQGIIDLDLPISGSLNDPQFRLAPVVFKIIGNIIRKAVTAPFSLLTGAFAAEDDQQALVFAPGRATLEASVQENLQKLAQAMQRKPQLKLTLTGQADPQAEAQAWKRAQLEAVVQGPPSPDGADPRTPRQKAAALKRLYRTTVQDKPRNMLGMSKDLPPEEMETLILRDMVIPPNAWTELAQLRAQAVRDYLLQQGVDAQRVFLGRGTQSTQQPASSAVLLDISVQ